MELPEAMYGASSISIFISCKEKHKEMGLVILINKILSGDQRLLKYLLFKLVNTVFLRIFRCYSIWSICNIRSSDFDVRDCGGFNR